MSEEMNPEFAALSSVFSALEPLSQEARFKVMRSAATMLGIDDVIGKPKSSGNNSTDEDGSPVVEEAESASTFPTFAELFAAAEPNTNADKVLVAGYWLQALQGAENFGSHAINKELANLGHKISHMPSAFEPLTQSKPQLVLQLRKSGGSQQARKTFKLSMAGIERVKDMISG